MSGKNEGDQLEVYCLSDCIHCWEEEQECGQSRIHIADGKCSDYEPRKKE